MIGLLLSLFVDWMIVHFFVLFSLVVDNLRRTTYFCWESCSFCQHPLVYFGPLGFVFYWWLLLWFVSYCCLAVSVLPFVLVVI